MQCFNNIYTVHVDSSVCGKEVVRKYCFLGLRNPVCTVYHDLQCDLIHQFATRLSTIHSSSILLYTSILPMSF